MWDVVTRRISPSTRRADTCEPSIRTRSVIVGAAGSVASTKVTVMYEVRGPGGRRVALDRLRHHDLGAEDGDPPVGDEELADVDAAAGQRAVAASVAVLSLRLRRGDVEGRQHLHGPDVGDAEVALGVEVVDEVPLRLHEVELVDPRDLHVGVEGRPLVVGRAGDGAGGGGVDAEARLVGRLPGEAVRVRRARRTRRSPGCRRARPRPGGGRRSGRRSRRRSTPCASSSHLGRVDRLLVERGHQRVDLVDGGRTGSLGRHLGLVVGAHARRPARRPAGRPPPATRPRPCRSGGSGAAAPRPRRPTARSGRCPRAAGRRPRTSTGSSASSSVGTGSMWSFMTGLPSFRVRLHHG